MNDNFDYTTTENLLSLLLLLLLLLLSSLLFLACEVSFYWSNNTFTVNFRQGV